MLFPPATLAAIADGRVDLAFRRWDRPRVRAGGRQRTPVGVIGFEGVDEVAREELTDDDARRAGFGSLTDLLAMVDRRPSGTIYRIRLRMAGPDPRVTLRETVPDDEELVAIARQLGRLDRLSRHGRWTRPTLEAIGDRPGVPAIELATGFGRPKRPFKADVRKLKELGLTESLRPGYRLSPRGQAVLEHLTGGLPEPSDAATHTPQSRGRRPAGR